MDFPYLSPIKRYEQNAKSQFDFKNQRPSVEVALASTQVVIGYLMASVYSGQGSNIQVHGMKCNHELKEWMGSSLCGTVNRKQEVSNIGCWELIAWRSLSLIAWRFPLCVKVVPPTVVRHPFLLFSSLFSSLSIPNSKVLFNGHLFIVFVTCEKLLYAFENCQNDA